MRTAFRIALCTLPLLLMTGCTEVPPPPDLSQKPAQEVRPVLSERERQHFGKDVFSRIDHVSHLPKEARDQLGEMADPGKDWSVGCTGSGPRQRLIFAAMSDDRLIVYSEFGGVVHGWRVHVFSIDNRKVVLKGHFSAEPDMRNLEQLKNAVAAAKMD